jgi:gamma-glutamyltranspeptidase
MRSIASISAATRPNWIRCPFPGTVLGLETALRCYGSMLREKLMPPAIALAQAGFVLARTTPVGFNDSPILSSLAEVSGLICRIICGE